MLKRILSPALAALLAFSSLACTVRKRDWRPNLGSVPAEKERVIGITTRTGEVKIFDSAATFEGQMLHAQTSRKPFQIAIGEVQRFWVEKRQFSTVRTVGLVAGLAAGVVLVAAVASSVGSIGGGGFEAAGRAAVARAGGCCLFVYPWNGREYAFETEAYTASVTRGLERDDYSLLSQIREQDGRYRLMISNDMDETQYTNFMELWLVDHAPGVEPRAGDDGELYGISAPTPPLSARDGDGNDLRPWLEKRDRLIWEPEPEPDANGDLRREIVMTFPRPQQATHARLVASATYTLWSGWTAAYNFHLLGPNLADWYRQIDTDPAAAAQLRDWMAREDIYVLHAEVDVGGRWETRGVVPVGGPFASDERVAPLDLTGVTGSELRIRLRPPAGFWALNSFAVDYGPESRLSVTRVPLASARDAQGNDLTPALSAADDLYYEMPVTGDRAWVEFASPQQPPGTERTIFLHSRGYYRMHVPENENPNPAEFERIMREPGAALHASAEIYAALKNRK